jgi:hypothetical protein
LENIMNTDVEVLTNPGRLSGPPVPPHRQEPWYQAYIAALFENDKAQIHERIQEAKRLILLRERELVNRTGDQLEIRSLNNALNALAALSNCLGL